MNPKPTPNQLRFIELGGHLYTVNELCELLKLKPVQIIQACNELNVRYKKR